MTRCSAFPSANLKPEEYINYVYSYRDPTIFFHVSGGAKVMQIISDYRPDDSDNIGAAVLISYDLASEMTPVSTSAGVANNTTADAAHIVREILHFIDSLNDPPTETSLEDMWNIPLMNILDSMSMQHVRNRIQELAEKELSISFLFQYPTLQAISNYFSSGASTHSRLENEGTAY